MSGHARVSGVNYQEITLAGKKYRLRAMPLGSYAEMEAYYVSLKDDPVVLAALSIPKVPSQYHAGIWEAALKVASQLRLVSSQDLSEFEQSVRGTAFKIWCCIRQDHGDEFKSVDDTLAMMERVSPAELDAIQIQMSLVNNEVELGNSSGQEPIPNPMATGPISTSTSLPSMDGTPIK